MFRNTLSYFLCYRLSKKDQNKNEKGNNKAKDKDQHYSLVDEQTKKFELLNKQINLNVCNYCHCASTRIKIAHTKHGDMCTDCSKSKIWEKDILKSLPIWFDDDNIPQFHLPPELQNLTEAEKLLISMINVYVPLHHLKQGQLASKGHCCCIKKPK